MPFYSSQDVETIEKAMHSLKAFPHVRDSAIRGRLASRAVKHKRILTLDSFRADVIFLEACYNPLSKLFSTKERTLREACKFSFKHAPELFRVCYIELWLKAIRNYEHLSSLPSAKPKKDKGQDVKEPRPKSEAKFTELAFFASSRGFEPDQITKQLAEGTKAISPESTSADLPKLSSDRDSLPVHLRCNRSTDSMFEKDRQYLSLKNVYHDFTGPRKKSATSFAVLKDIVHCFFGEITLTELPSEDRLPVPTEMTVEPSEDQVARPTRSICKGAHRLQSPLSVTRSRSPDQNHPDEMELGYEVPLGTSSMPSNALVRFQSTLSAEQESTMEGQPEELRHKSKHGSQRNYTITKSSRYANLSSLQQRRKARGTKSQNIQELYLGRTLDEGPTENVWGLPSQPIITAELHHEQNIRRSTLSEDERSSDATKQAAAACLSTGGMEHEKPISGWELVSQQSVVQYRSPREEKITDCIDDQQPQPSLAQQDKQHALLRLSKAIPLDEASTDRESFRSSADLEKSKEKPTGDFQALQEQALPNSTREKDNSADESRGELQHHAHESRLTHQQFHDEAKQRRDKKRRLRSRILQKLTGQREPSETEGTDANQYVGEESQDQAQPQNAQQRYETQEIGEEVETLSQQRQEADDYMRSAAEAVEEVYDNDENVENMNNSPRQETANLSERQIPPELEQHWKRVSEFPGGDLRQRPCAPYDVPSMSGESELARMDGPRGNETREGACERPKRQAIRNAVELLGSEHDGLSQEKMIISTDPANQIVHTADPRRMTPFPGPLSCLESVRGNDADSESNSEPSQPLSKQGDQAGPNDRVQVAELSKRRKRFGEPEEESTSVQSSKQQAQLNSWESMKDLVASVESIWHSLDHTRIHITSTEEIENLDSNRVSNHERLWSWSRGEKDRFKSQIGPLLHEKGFRLQMVSRNRESISRIYSTVSEMGYWISYYDFNDSAYWLAILFREPNAGRSWKKVRRTVAPVS